MACFDTLRSLIGVGGLLGIVALLIVPERVILADREMLGRSLLVGFGAAVILWATGLTVWRQGTQVLRQ